MPFSTLKRNKDAVLNALYQTQSGSLLAKEDLKIVFPVRFEEANLAIIESNVYVLGIFAIIVGNQFAVNNIPARIRLSPSEIEKEKYEDNEYYVLSFDKGATICENINVVQENTLGYYIYNYFIALGKVPWYISALDMLRIFEGMNEYTKTTYGASHTVTEMICAMVMRGNLDAQQYWRQTIESEQDLYNNRPEFIPLRNIPLGARNTTAKLMGAYFDEGLNSALLYPSESAERVETLLRQ